jgi:copper chaperone CopZ
MTTNQVVKDPLLKKRKFDIENIPEDLGIRRIEESLRGSKGVMTADIDTKRSVIRLEYDLRQVKFENIEKLIEKSGLTFSRKLFQRWKRGMAKFTEQNELDNLNAPASSCCKDPKENADGCSSCLSRGKN